MQLSFFNSDEDEITKTNHSAPKMSDKIEKESQLLLTHVASGTTNTLRDKVAWILNSCPETRNSDISLTLKFWETFESEFFDGQKIFSDDLYNLSKQTSIVRERARIQNVYKLFSASSDIRKLRKDLSEEENKKSIEEKLEGVPLISIYMDESGKNEENLIVGSLWCLDVGISSFNVVNLTVVQSNAIR